jgi:hypothetical protein
LGEASAASIVKGGLRGNPRFPAERCAIGVSCSGGVAALLGRPSRFLHSRQLDRQAAVHSHGLSRVTLSPNRHRCSLIPPLPELSPITPQDLPTASTMAATACHLRGLVGEITQIGLPHRATIDWKGHRRVRTSRKSSIFLRRMIRAMFMRVNSTCAHQERPPLPGTATGTSCLVGNAARHDG